MAREIAQKYKIDIDPERTTDPDEYEAIACALHVTTDIHMLYANELMHFKINAACKHVVKVFLSGSGGTTVIDCKGHFDYIFVEPPDLSAPMSHEMQNVGFGT